jgi:ArsR family transcriptional regulator
MFEHAADVLQAMGQATRLKILSLLAGGERCVCDLQATLSEPQPTVSRHLMILRRAGLVRAQRSRNRVIYALSDPRITDLLTRVEALVDRKAAHTGRAPAAPSEASTDDTVADLSPAAPSGHAKPGTRKKMPAHPSEEWYPEGTGR